jgi:predicted proteasome-type protease
MAEDKHRKNKNKMVYYFDKAEAHVCTFILNTGSINSDESMVSFGVGICAYLDFGFIAIGNIVLGERERLYLCYPEGNAWRLCIQERTKTNHYFYEIVHFRQCR